MEKNEIAENVIEDLQFAKEIFDLISQKYNALSKENFGHERKGILLDLATLMDEASYKVKCLDKVKK